jgi:myxalamid-type polyketide synthase MxaB
MAALFDSPTVTGLAETVEPFFESAGELKTAGGTKTTADPPASPSAPPPPVSDDDWQPLVALTSEGQQEPLFCVHPVGGDLRCYGEMARCMRGQRPVWGLRARGLDPGTRPHDTLTALAADYARAILRTVPEGPYRLAGWSTGGLFAYELARQLLSQRAEVASLILLDTPLPSIFVGADLADDARFLVDLVQFSNWFAGSQMQISYEQLHQQSEQAALQTVLNLARQHAVLPPETTLPQLQRLIGVCRKHAGMIQGYRVRPTRVDIQLVRPVDTRTLAEASGQELEEDLGWSRLIPGLPVRHVPGNHFSMMTGENARALARVVAECLATRPSRTPHEVIQGDSP